MKCILPYILTLLLVFTGLTATAQQTDSLTAGKLSGIAFDSTHQYVLRNASVAVYNHANELLTFSLSDNLGEFSLQKLPVRQSLKLVISYVGYRQFSKILSIDPKNSTVDLKHINLLPGNTALNEVVVSAPPPLHMNGDTLEFNADAFQLDKNAVAEDLMTHLPGVVVWGDGTITVNGRPVSSVVVDGKSFFGGNAAVATQNIPKDAIDKIQVYQKGKQHEPVNPQDSVTEINISLKDDKHYGYFGEASAAYGTRKTYQGDLNINFFNPQSQLGVVATFNNINKIATSVTDLMLQHTFKSLNITFDDQPDFNRSGLNRSLSAGMFYHHQSQDDQRKRRSGAGEIGLTYFFNRNVTDNLTNIKTLTTLGPDSTIEQTSNNIASGIQMNHRLALNQVRLQKGENMELTFAPVVSFTSEDNTSAANIGSTSNKAGMQSVSNAQSAAHMTTGKFTLETRFENKFKNNTELSMTYTIDYNRANANKTSKSVFVSFADAGTDQHIDRKARDVSADLRQYLSASWRNLSYLLFGHGHFMSTVNIELNNDIDYTAQSVHQTVSDRDTITKYFLDNNYLSYQNTYRIIDEKPALRISKVFVREEAERYTKSFSFALNLEQQFYMQQNRSSHVFQRFNRMYQRFVPSLSVNYVNDQEGRFRDGFYVNIKRYFDYATVDMLYPIVDSTNFYYLPEGNPNLRPAETRDISLKYSHNSEKIDYGITLNGAATDGFFAGSAFVNENGTTISKTINLDGRRSMEIVGKVEKAFKLPNVTQLQLTNEIAFMTMKSPNTLVSAFQGEQVLNISHSNQWRNKMSVYFLHHDKLAVNLSQNTRYYFSTQKGMDNTRLATKEYNWGLRAGYIFSNRLNISTTVTANRFTSSAAEPVDFTIWNASASYRFLRRNNLELKFQALDLLGQNKSVANLGNNYVITQETHNVLQRYFMLTITYFPRKFGE